MLSHHLKSYNCVQIIFIRYYIYVVLSKKGFYTEKDTWKYMRIYELLLSRIIATSYIVQSV